MDTETATASHYSSLPSFEPQANAARRAVTGVGHILKRKFAFREESQTPHQTNDNLTKTDLGLCGPFVLFMMRYFLDKIFEPNGQLKSNPQVCLPPGPKLTFNSISERVKIMRLLVASRIPPGHREESTDLQDEIGSVTLDLDHRSGKPEILTTMMTTCQPS